MSAELTRRDLVKSAIACTAFCVGCSQRQPIFMQPQTTAEGATPKVAGLISPGCRGTKVRVGRIYAGKPSAHWPTPTLDLAEEVKQYELHCASMKELADVEFVGNSLVTSVEEAAQARAAMADVDGILIIHLSMGITPIVREVLAANKPTVLFAAPYSGHEWTGFGATVKKQELFDCMLTSDKTKLAAAVRPFRAIHHLREAKIVNVTARPWPAEWREAVSRKFGTQFVTVDRERMLKAYESISEADAETEARWWLSHARAVVEPSTDEVVRSCRLALAFEKILDEENATVITTDCYGSMYHQLPAFPCVGNVRLNNMGLGGICESDFRSAMTHIILQGLTGRPGFISDPTMDESRDAIILAHCLGSMKMDGPDGEIAPFKLRSIMERQEGCVPQVFMRVGTPVTQAILVGTDQMPFFTGTIIETPDTERGCRTKITVKVDGNARQLWQNWTPGLHRVTCYGNVREDLTRFCRFTGIKMTDEAA
ncbi:MAG TPA: hypothetical protein PKG54_04605 [Phycisphaerae bacterium]|nr:hypothetical protein [Phycisphaerae bacterium]HQA46686.1 hypothetical protein [Phycisphaerae bacterium]HXK87772.1 hypothetical protein [Phycisphaerae bacterium]